MKKTKKVLNKKLSKVVQKLKKGGRGGSSGGTLTYDEQKLLLSHIIPEEFHDLISAFYR